MPILLLATSIVGIYMSLVITLLLVAAITLLAVWFIPMIDELKHFIVGVAVILATIIWINIYLFP